MGDAIPWVNLFVSAEFLESATMDPKVSKNMNRMGCISFQLSFLRTLIE